MKSPSDIAAVAVRDELYAGAAFAKWITKTGAEFRSSVENDPRAQTEFMARRILDHLQDNYESIPPEHAVDLVEAALIAARDGEPHVRCRAEKDLANALRFLGRFGAAAAAVQRASFFASLTFATELHRGTIEFSMAALCDGTEQPMDAVKHAEKAIRIFEKHDAHDRAYSVREYRAYMDAMSGYHLVALAAYQDAAERARAVDSRDALARAYDSIAHCYQGLNDLPRARKYFLSSARVFRTRGCALLEARALRSAACAAIRLHGETAVGEMDTPKAAFLGLGLAGEVCRSTVAIMQELVLLDPQPDLAGYCGQLEDEALALGILKSVYDAVAHLKEAVQKDTVNEKILSDTWDAFGAWVRFPAISPLSTVQH